MLKLHAGELVLADLSGNGIDHFLLFHVCEILRITLHRDDDGSSRVRGEDPHAVVLEVGVLKRCVCFLLSVWVLELQVSPVPSHIMRRNTCCYIPGLQTRMVCPRPTQKFWRFPRRTSSEG